MRDRTVTRVESWDARPFSGGFATLRELADASFSGVVVADDAWLFMLNGRVVGLVDGDIDDFQDASGTMYEAPDPALPLLFSMQERGGSTQAKYYTNDTPLEEADRTLRDANFTGFVELSENVLSGDYYLVYYGGRVLPVAFVGTTDELTSGEDAYELAADEVGVYEVIKTPVNVTQIPEPAAAAGTGAVTDAADADPDDARDAAADTSQSTPSNAPSADTPPAESAADVDAAPESTSPAAESAADPAPREEDATPSTPEPVTEAEPAQSETAAEPTLTDTETTPESVTAAEPTPTDADSSTSTTDAATAGPEGGDESSVFSEEEQWRQTKSIPSLSPSEREQRIREGEGVSASAESVQRTENADTPRGRAQRSDRMGEPANGSAEGTTRTEAPSEPAAQDDDSTGTETSAATTTDRAAENDGETAAVQEEVAVREEVATLEARLEELGGERDALAADLESVRDERDRLEERVTQLESALEEAGGETTPGPNLTPAEALTGTNLFVRYGSKGKPTLDDLQGKNPDPDAINTNLRIDHHTQFESGDASVDGIPFGQFLEGSSAFRFVSWLVRDLPYEVLDAGHRSGFGDLYGVIPDIDRAELQGTVEVDLEDGVERRDFDVVLRDRMGNPLVVADLNDSRDPVTGEEMETLVEAAQAVGEGTDDLGGAFYVTASFFEPDALENAGTATATGGLLSRSDRLSYVKLSRKRGFHLCLAEDRNETFNLTVPEL